MVIAIIAILIGLLLPAVQKVRESAAATQCENHLKQMTLGCMTHESTHKYLPHGGWGFQCVGLPNKGFGATQPGGWMYSLLPYIEKQDVYYLPTPKQLVETAIPTYHCPSRRPARTYPAGPVGWQPYWTGTLTVCARADYAMTGALTSTAAARATPTFPPPSQNDGVAPGRRLQDEGNHRRHQQHLPDRRKVHQPRLCETADDPATTSYRYIGDRDTLFLQQVGQDKGPRLSWFGSVLGGFFMAFCDGHVPSVLIST